MFSPAGVNFINILQAAFMRTDHESPKKTFKSAVSFSLLGHMIIKAARKMFMKLTPVSYTLGPRVRLGICLTQIL